MDSMPNMIRGGREGLCKNEVEFRSGQLGDSKKKKIDGSKLLKIFQGWWMVEKKLLKILVHD